MSVLQRIPRWLLWSASTLIVVLLLLTLLVPPLVKSQAIKIVAEKTGRVLTIESLRFNPMTLAVTLRGFVLSEKDQTTPFVSFARLKVALSLKSLWEQAAIVREITLEEPRVRLVRTAANSYNFSDLMKAGDPKDAAPEATLKNDTAKKPLLFSLNNIHIDNGVIDFTDRATAREEHHQISELTVGIPFLGNIPYLTDLFVTPELKARVNDAPVHFVGKLKPFKDGAETIVNLTLSEVDLPRYAGYLPAELPVKLASGTFSSTIDVIYRVAKDKKPDIILSGHLQLDRLALRETNDTPLFAVTRCAADLQDTRPLAGDIHLALLEIAGIEAVVSRDKSGRLNLQRLGGATPPPAVPVGGEEEAAKADKAPPPRVRIDSFKLTDSQLAFNDDVPSGGFRTVLDKIGIEVRGLDTAGPAPAQLGASFITSHGEQFNLSGTAVVKPLDVALRAALDGVPLADYFPYLQPYLVETVRGRLDATVALRLTASDGVRVEDGTVKLSDLQVPFRSGEGLRLATLALAGLKADPKNNNYAVGTLALERGHLQLTRFADGALSPLLLLRRTAAPAASGTIPSAEPVAVPPADSLPAQRPPTFQLGSCELRDWTVTFVDEVPAERVKHRLDRLNISARNFDYPRLGLEQLTVQSRYAGSGEVRFTAGGVLSPLDLSGEAQLKRFPGYEVSPYMPPQVHVMLADGTIDSRLHYRVAKSGDRIVGNGRGKFAVNDLYLLNAQTADDLLRWKSLALDGIDVDLGARRAAVASIALDGLTTQVTIETDGGLNFRKLVDSPTPPQEPPVVETAPPDEKGETEATAAAPPWNIALPLIVIGNSRLDFSDRHMTPAFHSRLTEINGRISGLNSTPEMMADVALRAALDGRSPLSITGVMNPLRTNPYVKLKVDFSDIELSPFTPYAGRYAGYTIDRGKLFLDLDYRIEEKRLDGGNRVFIDQFTFGQATDSPDATALPVRLAVALLKDNKGEIHIDLPVTGRTDDPQFSIWSIVVQVLKNLIVKAATSPFSLLSSLMGGGPDFTAVVFAPGTATISDSDAVGLAKLAEALKNRPALKLQLTGHAEVSADSDGYRREQFEAKLKRAKYLELTRQKTLPPGATVETLVVTPEERALYLKEVYARESFSKPRTAFGTLKPLPDAEMEELILANIKVGSEELTQLAWQRSATVQQLLTDKHGLPPARIFQNNVVVTRPPDKPADWSPSRVEFGMAVE